MKITIHNINKELERLVDIGVPVDKAIVWFRQQLAVIMNDESVGLYERKAAEIALKLFDESSGTPPSQSN